MNEQVEAEIINTETEFKWRLKMGEETSPYTSHYEGILKHTFKNGKTWFLASAYWEGVFPVEIPFQIKETVEY